MDAPGGTGMRAAEGAFMMTRTVDAPRERVWRAFTEREQLMQWFAPQGCSMPACTLDLRPGGLFHYCMRTADGAEMWGKWIFRDIDAPRELVAVVSFSDAQGGVTRHPLVPAWPLETLSTTSFEDRDGKTAVTVRWGAINATDEERRTFDASHDAMRMGWTGTFAQLDAFLAAAPPA